MSTPVPGRPDSGRMGAQVSLRERAAGPKRETLRAFLAMGFQVFEADDGVTLSIQGPPSLFAKVFRRRAEDLASRTMKDDLQLATPAELRDRVQSIFLLPPPETFGMGAMP